MITPENFRKLALEFPHTDEQDHRGHPSFRVDGKIFTTLWPAEMRGVLKLDIENQADLIRIHPEIFSLNAWSKQGWTEVDLKHVAMTECRQLLEEAWRLVAPKKFGRSYDENNRPTC